MTLKLQAIFDGTVFRPCRPVDLQPDTECELTIETEFIPSTVQPGQEEVYALSAIAAMAVDMGITDLEAAKKPLSENAQSWHGICARP